MILKVFKQKSNKKHLNKLLAKRQVNFTEDVVSSVGVVFNINEFSDFKVFSELQNLLKINANHLKIIAFSSRPKKDLEVFEACYTPKDFGWKGTIENDDLQTFLNTKFDVLISFYEKEILELKLITATSNAKFKIGISQTDQRLNDLIIKVSVNQFSIFKEEIFKYLTILKKIKTNE